MPVTAVHVNMTDVLLGRTVTLASFVSHSSMRCTVPSAVVVDLHKNPSKEILQKELHRLCSHLQLFYNSQRSFKAEIRAKIGGTVHLRVFGAGINSQTARLHKSERNLTFK